MYLSVPLPKRTAAGFSSPPLPFPNREGDGVGVRRWEEREGEERKGRTGGEEIGEKGKGEEWSKGAWC